MNAMLPPSRKGLTINRYDGMIDPNKHVDVYVT